MPTSITNLDDTHALTALSAFARAHQNQAGQLLSLSPDLREALEAAFPGESPRSATSPADAARAALALLAEHPQHGPAIRALVEHPSPQRFDLGSTALIVTAVLIALQTHIRIQRDEEGKYKILVEKKPTDAGLLGDLIRKLLKLAGG